MRRFFAVTTLWLAGLAIPPAAAQAPAIAQTAPSVQASHALPPTVADIVLLLRSYQPDVERIRRLRAEAGAPVAASGDAADLAIAWHKKALAAAELQEYQPYTAYLEQALAASRRAQLAPSALGGYWRVRLDLAISLWFSRSAAASQDSLLEFINEIGNQGRARGFLLSSYYHAINNATHLGDPDTARAYLDQADSLLKELASQPQFSLLLPHFSHLIEQARGFYLTRTGKLEAGERAYLAAIRQGDENVRMHALREARSNNTLPLDRIQQGTDSTRIFYAQNLLQQQRLDEAELLLRDVIKSSLSRNGRNSFVTGRGLWALSRVFTERGRHAEAVVLAEWADRALAEAGIADSSPVRLNGRIVLVNALTAAGRASEAVALIDAIRAKIADDTRLEEGFGHGSLQSIRALIQTGRITDALRDGDNLMRHHARHYGTDSYYTAEARAYRSMALHRHGRTDEARKEFAAAVQVLTDPDKITGKNSASAARANRLRFVLNEYLQLLVGSKGSRTAGDIAEAFRIADVARWQSVQKAVAGSALRAAAGTPELGARIKQVQDADDELQAIYKNLITQRSAPPDRQLPAVIKAMEARIAELQAQQQRNLTEIRRQFPQYDALINPRPVDLASVRRALQPHEALLSVYVTPTGTYVWATGPDGELHFHFSAQKPDWVAAHVKRLRDSVDLTTGIPLDRLRFDLQAGAALYQELLAPVEPAWARADTLLVVASDPLGQIPFSLLPTRAPTPEPPASDTRVPLTQYRQAPWLARKVAVAYLPSVSALVTLRALPASSSARAPFIGFGDPDFGSGSSPAPQGGVRNLQIKHAPRWDENQTSADVPLAPPPPEPAPTLTPLPDTREEITAIAAALSADPQRDAYFGPQANRRNVLGGDLKRRRVVAFATHGLVAGDLPGLDQPALALSPAPGQPVTDGLLKLEDILKLSLDADLVVLSACNTAAADGSGAESISGLGRGFFYAGARAVLVTHWPVETVSARMLVTRLFQRYASDPRISRAQALRHAMLELMDGAQQGHDAQNRAISAYAHPAFWAPYALYGDPGR